MINNIILCKKPQYLEEAYHLAKFTNMIEVLKDETLIQNFTKPYLYLDVKGLAIYCENFKPLYVDEIYTKLQKRELNLANELLIQAIKIKDIPKNQVMVLDLTAGLARDTSLITSYGYNVTMVEKNPILATIIYYAIINKYIHNAQIIFMDSINYLNNIRNPQMNSHERNCGEAFNGNFDNSPAIDNQQSLNMNSLPTMNVIYLDPMFKQNKSSKAKKEMQIIQIITDEPENSPDNDIELFKHAQNYTNKIVVKRDHKQAPLINNPKPTYSKIGKTIRYDIYTKTR